MPKRIFGCNLIIAERLIMEDNTFTAVRIVDLFNLKQVPEIPLEKQGVEVQVLVQLKTFADDDGEHIVRLSLIRPNGETTELVKTPLVLTSTLENYPRGGNLRLNIGIAAKAFGTHYFVLEVDGEERNRAAFILRPDTEGDK